MQNCCWIYQKDCFRALNSSAFTVCRYGNALVPTFAIYRKDFVLKCPDEYYVGFVYEGRTSRSSLMLSCDSFNQRVPLSLKLYWFCIRALKPLGSMVVHWSLNNLWIIVDYLSKNERPSCHSDHCLYISTRLGTLYLGASNNTSTRF